MSQKVLVLCQRRTSNVDVLTPVTDSINTLVSSLIGEGAEIKYVSDLTPDELSDADGVDLIGHFGDNDFTRENFKENEYSLIICNTCPFIWLDYSVIYKYLKADGRLALTAFSRRDNIAHGIYSAANGYEHFINEFYRNSLGSNSAISKWFVPVEYPNPVVSLFEKLPTESEGGGKNRKTKHNVHNTYKRRKTKKVRQSRKLRRRKYKK
jgi:hypothetical protein